MRTVSRTFEELFDAVVAIPDVGVERTAAQDRTAQGDGGERARILHRHLKRDRRSQRQRYEVPRLVRNRQRTDFSRQPGQVFFGVERE